MTTNQKQHAQASVECFNGVWTLLDQSKRTAEEDRLMREMAHASLFHWMKRKDCQAENLSIGLWQVSRVHAVLGDAPGAMIYGRECLEMSESLSPFLRGYAHEAIARAAQLGNEKRRFKKHLKLARELSLHIEEKEDLKLLEADLEALEKEA